MSTPILLPRYEASWAVVVGINDYPGGRLAHARNDAIEVGKRLVEKFGFPKANVAMLLDGEATLRGIQDAVHKLNNTGTNDRVVIFFAGHGHTVPSYRGEAGFLVPVDADIRKTSSLLPWNDLVHTSTIIPAKHLLFVMDACYGGLIGMRSLPGGTQRFVRDMMVRRARQYLTAGKADQMVADGGGPRKGHSMFTGYLLEALDGECKSEDGLISANQLMAYVSDRVSKDSASCQTPHSGLLDGDGDFFLTPPPEVGESSEKGNDDRVIEIPLGSSGFEPNTSPNPLLEHVKACLSSPSRRIDLFDTVAGQAKAAQRRIGPVHFPVQGGSVGGEFADRLVKYEDAVRDVLNISVLLGRWANGEQVESVKEIVHMLLGSIQSTGGLTVWLSLRYFPAYLSMYAGGMGAIAGDNYQSLRAFFETPVYSERSGKLECAVKLTVDAMTELRGSGFKLVPGFEQKYVPQSEYMFLRMQPILEDILHLGRRYEPLFDKFEILLCLAYLDLAQSSWAPLGRFGWKYGHLVDDDNPYSALVAEAKRQGAYWGPLRAGMFGGSIDRFVKLAELFESGTLRRLGWR